MTPPLPMQMVKNPTSASPGHCEDDGIGSPRPARIAVSTMAAAV
jgi:hypothetical protein